MLERCLQDVLAAGPPLASAAPFLAFLEPSGGLPVDPGAGPGTPGAPWRSRGSAPAQPGFPPADADGAPLEDAPPAGSGGAGQYGSLVRLLTEEAPRRSDTDQARVQRGECAACHEPLGGGRKAGGWGRSSTKGGITFTGGDAAIALISGSGLTSECDIGRSWLDLGPTSTIWG
jgi:hypothetical protein